MKTWQTLDPDELEFQYNPQATVDDFTQFQTFRQAVANISLTAFPASTDIPYGEGPKHKLDIFPAKGTDGAPVHIFIHGGYWRAQDKKNFAFLARDLLPQGISLVTINYDLCPTVTLDEVSASAINAIEWCYRNIADHGGDPNAISISGHSAGAHLCSMALATDWQERGLSNDIIKGAVMISGVYDPEPAKYTSVNAVLGLNDEIVARNDTLSLPPKVKCPTWIFAGGQEPWGWIDLSFDYSRHLRQHGLDPDVHVLPGYHHFNIMDQYLIPNGPIARAVAKACGAA